MREYAEESREYWNRKWTFGEGHRERVFLDGSDGENEFDRELLKKTVRKIVLDEGCGSGTFTMRVAKRAKRVTGIDTSSEALAQARKGLVRYKRQNVEFRFASASRLPFGRDEFDIVYSRRGPGSVSRRTLSEAYRVLKKGGEFREITIGERDKLNIASIFGRGQMLRVRGQVSDRKASLLSMVGFRQVVARDYIGTEVFQSMRDLLVRLNSAPIIPSFDARKDRQHLKRVERELSTDRGIETPVHRVVLIGYK